MGIDSAIAVKKIKKEGKDRSNKEKEERKLKKKLEKLEKKNQSKDAENEEPAFFVDTEGSNMEVDDTTSVENNEEKKSKTSRGRREKQKKEKSEVRLNDESDITISEDSIFFGIVDRTELEYFKTAESTLSANAFANSEERTGFIVGVLQEAKGKELKLVTNQICSKLVERLILLANNRQLLDIFKAFSGHFLNLSKHKYSSHCVETLLVRSAALVERELLSSNPMELYKEEGDEEKNDEAVVTMENLFIFMLNELKPELKKLTIHEYGSHVLRLLLLVLSGSKLPSTTTKSSLRSKKSKIARKMISINDNDEFETAYQVPAIFKENLQETLVTLTSDVNTVASARELAINKIASPVIQLIVRLECSASSSSKKKQRKKNSSSNASLTNLLFQMDPNSDKESTEESFVEYLLSDPIGLYFFEAVIADSLPSSTVQRLYTQYMSHRLDKLIRRDSVANFIFPALLKKLPPQQIKEIIDSAVSSLDVLINSNNHLIVRAVLSSSSATNYKVNEVTDIIVKKFSSTSNSDFLEKLLKLEGSTLGNSRDDDWPTNEERHRALFVESLIAFSPKFLKDISIGFIELPEERLIQVTKHSIFSHVLQSCLVPESDIIIRRRLLNNLTTNVVDLACNAYASHIVDSLWKYTYKLKHFRERIADQLTNDSNTVKNSMYGKLVWKNWELEKYVRKRFEWWTLVKQQEDALSELLGQSRSAVESKQRRPPPKQPFPAHRTGPNRDRPSNRPPHTQKPYDRPNRRYNL